MMLKTTSSFICTYRCLLAILFVLLGCTANEYKTSPRHEELFESCKFQWIYHGNFTDIVTSILKNNAEGVIKYIVLKSAGGSNKGMIYQFKFFGVLEDKGVYIKAFAPHIEVRTFEKSFAEKLFVDFIPAHFPTWVDHYGSDKYENMASTMVEGCDVMKIATPNQTHIVKILDYRKAFLESTMRGQSTENNSVTALFKIERGLDSNHLPIPLTAWEKKFDLTSTDFQSELDQEKYKQKLEDNLFYELEVLGL